MVRTFMFSDTAARRRSLTTGMAALSENMKVLTMDAKDYYLNTPLTRPEFLRIPLKFIAPSSAPLNTIPWHNSEVNLDGLCARCLLLIRQVTLCGKKHVDASACT